MTFNPLDPLGSILDWMLQGAVDAWKQASKFALQAGAINDDQWKAASDIVGKLSGVMLFVVIVSAAFTIIKAAVAGRFADMFKALGQAIFAWPLTLAVLYVIIQVNTMATALTGKILNVDLSKPDVQIGIPDLNADAAKAAFAAPLMLVFLIIILLGAASIVICMAARAFLLVLAVCLLPFGTMNIGFSASWATMKRYLGWIIGIIIYQPLVAIMLTITGQLMKASGDSSPLAFIEAMVGMILTSVSPWVVIRKVIQILPVQHGVSAAANTGQQAVQTTKEVAQKAVEVGAQVAGAVATGGASLAGGAGALGKTGGLMSKTSGGGKATAGAKALGEHKSSTGTKTSSDSKTPGDQSQTHTPVSARVGAAVAAASSAMPKTPGVQGAIAAATAFAHPPQQAAPSSSASAPATSATAPNGAPHENTSNPALSDPGQPEHSSARHEGNITVTPPSSGTPKVDVHVQTPQASHADVHVDQQSKE